MSAKGFCVCMVFILFLSLPPAYGYTTNVLTDPGFEGGGIDWEGRWCPFETVGDPVHSGSLSGRAYDRDENYKGIRQSMVGKMMPGETYDVSAWVRIGGADSNTVTLSFEQTDADGTNYYNVASVTATDTGWVEISGSFTLEVNEPLGALYFYFEGPEPGIDLYVDDANVFGPAPEPPPPPDPCAAGLIDVYMRHQTMEGFGAAGSWYEDWLTNHPLKSELYDILFGELGLDIYRVRNCYDQDYYEDYMLRTSEIITEGELSLGRPIKVMMSSWSPPAYLKDNNDTVGGTLRKDPCDGEFMYEEFAKWWYDSLVEWSSHDVNATYLNIQNEPDYVGSWDTCLFLPTETEDAAGYNLAFEAVWP